MGTLMNGAGFSLTASLVPFGMSWRYRKAPLFLNATLRPSLLELEYHGIWGMLFLLLLHPGQAAGLLHQQADVSTMSAGNRRVFL